MITRRQFTFGDRVETTEPYRGFDSGLEARVVSVDPRSGRVTVAPWVGETPSVLLFFEASSLRRSRT
ncbi:MAG: hypothetical protein QOI31_1301 [Solirubrobacterales bacterium]|jgi:hypothetical protein|nr:hypothetical protein [Solirubrobacterales bacterium]